MIVQVGNPACPTARAGCSSSESMLNFRLELLRQAMAERRRLKDIAVPAARPSPRSSFLFSFFSCLFLVFFSCSQVRAHNYDSAQLSRADSLKAVARLCSLLIEVPNALVM